jgi:hypothetical protein
MEDAVTTSEPRWHKWLRRIGYVTTAFVSLQLCFILYLITKEAIEEYRQDQRQIASTRTTAGPLRQNPNDQWVRPLLIERLSALAPLQGLGENGIRFVANPSFGYADYGLTLRVTPNATVAQGTLLIFVRGDAEGALRTVRTIEFTAPHAEAVQLLRQIDRLTEHYEGNSEFICLDGTNVAFERTRDGSIWSGEGNCEPTYDQLGGNILSFVRRHVQSSILPTEDDWHRMMPINP